MLTAKDKLILLLIKAYNLLNNLSSKILRFSLRDGWVQELDDFEQSAHRHKIVLRSVAGTIFEEQVILDDHFALALKSRESPVTAILEDAKATLLGCTKTHAIFSVCNTNVYDLERKPFVYMGQVEDAHEIITIPLQHFVKLSKMVGRKRKILLLNNTARCGSTLMTKMLDAMDNLWAISEPDFLTRAGYLDFKFSIPAEDVIRAGLILQCKPGLGREEVDLTVIKTQSITVGFTPLIHKACPEVYQAFMFRDPKGNIASVISMARGIFLGGDYKDFWIKYLEEYINQATVSDSKYKPILDSEVNKALTKKYSEERCATLFWAAHVLTFKDSKKRLGIDVFGFTYEQVLKDPEGTVSNLLIHCQTSDKYAKQATKPMLKDSQSNSYLSRDKLKKIKRLSNFSQEEVAMMDEIFTKVDLPTVENYRKILD